MVAAKPSSLVDMRVIRCGGIAEPIEKLPAACVNLIDHRIMIVSHFLRALKNRALSPVMSAVQTFALTLSILPCSAGAAAPPVPHLTIIADNAVDALRALAARREESYQVLLWRADNYLREHFKNMKLEAITKELDAAGARKISEWGEDPTGELHNIRYLVQSHVIKSHVGRQHDLLIELEHYRKPDLLITHSVIRVEFGIPFKKAAAARDYPHGTVLDCVFSIIELERRAKDTPRLDSIEVSYGKIGSVSSPIFGRGFHLDVVLSNPSSRAELYEQSVTYAVCSGLEPLGEFNLPASPPRKPEAHVARDILVPDAVPFGEKEHGYPQTFYITGSGESRRPAPRVGH